MQKSSCQHIKLAHHVKYRKSDENILFFAKKYLYLHISNKDFQTSINTY